MSETSSTKRIAKNTLMLYFRQILIMLVSLYTVRVVLNVLGAEDYGIYNVVAGVVVFFSFVNNAMASGTQRFLNFYLGKNDNYKVNEVYSASILIHLLIAFFFVLLAETVGLWFVSTQLNIPIHRKNVTNVVYQFSILTTVFSIVKVPYHAVIIAYEKMSFFALLSIIEAILKLLIVYLLVIAPFDKLVFYSFLLTLVAFITTLIYKLYCNKKFKIARYNKVTNFVFIKEQLSFSGWSTFGAFANVANAQGTNIVLNMFTSVTVNAAMGIANQVNTAVYSFVGNFQTAFNPQMIKSYAEGNKQYFINLICRTSKFSFFLLTYIAIPLLINAEFVLTLWLKDVPEYSVLFVQLIIIWALIDAWNGPLWMSIQATGNIKKYQIIVSFLIFSNLPLTITAFILGAKPEVVLIIRIILNVIITIWRVFFVGKRIQLPIKQFIINVLLRCVIVFILCYFFTLFIGKLITNSVLYFIITTLTSVILVSFFSIVVGISSEERKAFFQLLRNKLGR